MSASPLQTGEAVSVSRVVGSKQEQVGIIVNNSPAGITLEFLRHIALLHLDRKDPVRIKFWDKDAIYSWQGEILEALSPAGGSVIVSRPRAIKSERRGFQRFPLEIPLSFSVLFPGEQPSVAGKVFDATTKIISAGAAEFQTAVSLEKREILEMKLHLSASQKIHIIGRVTRFDKPSESTPVNSLVVRFLDLNSQDRDRIQRFLGRKY